MAAEQYDLIVVGSGPGGEKGAAQAAYFGKKVALIEKEPHLGGAAANTGTLPSKTLRETALFLSGFAHRKLAGVDFRGLKEKVTVRDFLARERFIKDRERARILENLKRHQVTLYKGTAVFVSPHVVAVRPQRCPEFHLEGQVILLAPGSYPYRPAVFPFHDPRVYDSDTILTLQEIPPTMLVVGGGVIGCEYACMFAALGIQVTLVEKRPRIMDFLDVDVTELLETRMQAAGVRLLFADSVASIEAGDLLEVRCHSGTVLKVHTILVSSGRCGNVEALGLERAGIAAHDRGRIPVNERYQTAVPHIYAVGDVIGSPALASTSMEQARVAMIDAFKLNIYEGNKEHVAPVLPYGIYTIPECSMAGATEASLASDQVAYVAGKASYANNARGQIIGDDAGFLKLLFREDDMRLLGVHVIGEQATELVHVGLTALLLGASADLFIQTCYNYPTLTEVYKYATYDALGKRAARRKG